MPEPKGRKTQSQPNLRAPQTARPPAPAPAPAPARQPMSAADRYRSARPSGSQTDRGEYYREVDQRVRAAQEELEADPLGFQQYLMSRASAHDPRVSSAVFAANSMRASRAGVPQATADRALASMAASYAGSRLDPFYHSGGPLRDPVLSQSWAEPRSQAQYHAAAYACVDDPREHSRYGLHRTPTAPMAHHARYASRYGPPPGPHYAPF